MASNTSKSIPFLTIGFMGIMVFSKPLLGIEIDAATLQTVITALVPATFAGAAKSAIGKAAAARRAIPKELEEAMIAKMRDSLGAGRTPAA